jgi:hypothetical protein
MSTSSSGRVRVHYTLIRNVTSPEEQANGSRCFIAVCPLGEVLKFDTLRNLRDYIPAHDPKKRNSVHKGIEATLSCRSDRFIQYNGGLTISCSDIEVKDNEKLALVMNGSILNGAQTQGEIRRFLEGLSAEASSDDEKAEVPEVNARVEFVVEPDEMQITEIAIARNTSTDIKKLTMAGARKHFNELDESFRKIHKSLRLTKNETDVGDDFVDTGKLLQILWLLCPTELLNLGTRSVGEARLKSYKNRNYCLVDFENDVINKDKDDAAAATRYQCFVDLAGPAWSEYLKWQQHPAWAGKRLKGVKQIKRSGNSHLVSDGVIFPIIGAMSEFVKKDVRGRWSIEVPNIFEDEAMIEAAREQLSANKGQPMLMARTAGVYSALALIPKGYKRMLEPRDS